MKKIVALMLALLLLCSLVACSKDDETENGDDFDIAVTSSGLYYNAGGDYGDRYEYEIINGDEIAIIGFEASYIPHEIVLPTTIEDRPVVKIADSAFRAASNITAVTLPTGVREIGAMAFAGCEQLVKVTVQGTSITTIGAFAFSGCTALNDMVSSTTVAEAGMAHVALPEALTEIAEGAFYKCSAMEAVVIPASVKSVGDLAFMGCTKLQGTVGMEGVVTIGDYAFCGNAVMQHIPFGAALTNVGSYAFSGCPALAVRPAASVVCGENAFE